MITIDARLLIMEIAVSRLFFFFIFIFIYDKELLSKRQRRLLIPILYFILIISDTTFNNFGILLYIPIMYFLLNRSKNPNFYLINSIILSFLVSLLMSVLSSGLVAYIYRIFKIDDIIVVVIFLLFELIMVFLFSFLFKKINIKQNLLKIKSWTPSIGLSYLLIVLTIFIYFVQKLKAYTTLITGILVFLIIQSIAILLIIIYENNRQKEKFERKLMEEQLRNLKSYTQQLDSDQKEMHKFRHDYKNILRSLNDISDSDNNIELKNMLKKLGIYSNSYFDNISMDDFKDLEYVGNPYIKSILISKFKSIKSANIECYFECKNDINEIDMDIFDLIRIIGVSIDNAIEETEKQKNGKIQIILINQNRQVDIIIKNTTSNKIPISKMKEYGFSTKENHSGLGIVDVQDIKKKYRNLLIYYDVIDSWFCVQISIINQGDQK